MARKDLSRTVIEGGRSYYNSWQRRASHGIARAQQRAWLDGVRRDPDDDEDELPPRPHVGRNFHDKLGAARRWLASECGRPWAKVYSELRARFDVRTTAGRHIVFDHLLRDVWRGEPRRDVIAQQRWFVVDGIGILRRGRFYGLSYRKASALLARSR